MPVSKTGRNKSSSTKAASKETPLQLLDRGKGQIVKKAGKYEVIEVRSGHKAK